MFPTPEVNWSNVFLVVRFFMSSFLAVSFLLHTIVLAAARHIRRLISIRHSENVCATDKYDRSIVFQALISFAYSKQSTQCDQTDTAWVQSELFTNNKKKQSLDVNEQDESLWSFECGLCSLRCCLLLYCVSGYLEQCRSLCDNSTHSIKCSSEEYVELQ